MVDIQESGDVLGSQGAGRGRIGLGHILYPVLWIGGRGANRYRSVPYAYGGLRGRMGWGMRHLGGMSVDDAIMEILLERMIDIVFEDETV